MRKVKINDRCPLQSECGRKRCEYQFCERNCNYYQGNARPGAEIEDQAQTMEAEWEARMTDTSVLTDQSTPTAPQEAVPAVIQENNSPLVLLPMDRLHPHPDNPRKELGDLTELSDSIKANGIFQNLTVIPDDPTNSFTDFTVVIGHRRLAAAKLAGLTEVPCVISNMNYKEQLQTMLLENMQRNELTAYEQARGFQMMLDLGSTVDEIAEKSGFSKSTVRSRVKMAELDPEKLKKVSEERQISIGDLNELAKIDDLAVRNSLLNEIGTPNFNYALRTAIRVQEVQKVLPDAEKFLKYLKCKAISQQESWSWQYVRVGEQHDVRVWVGEAALPENAPFYFLDDKSGTLQFFKSRPQKQEQPESPEKLERKRKAGEVWNGLDECARMAFQLRHDFVEKLRCSYRNREKILCGAVIAAVVNAFGYIGVDRETLSSALDLPPEDSKIITTAEKTRQALDALKNPENRRIPMAVYALFNDGETENCASGYRSGGEWPEFRQSHKLNALYSWLTSLGYQPSDEESRLLNGTHELFHKGEQK